MLLVVVDVMASSPGGEDDGWSTSLSFRRGGRELEANALVAFSSRRIHGDVVEVVGIQSSVGVLSVLVLFQVQARNNPRRWAPSG